MQTASIGTVSHATMRPEDLIPAFLGVLKECDPESYRGLLEEWRDSLPHTGEDDVFESEQFAEWVEQEHEQVSYFLNEDLWYRLDELAPAFCYFGSTEGDGSDFGFWPSWDALEDAEHDGDLLKVSDTGDVPEDFSGYVLHVNDHGNTTLYHSENGGLTELWAIV